jgi:hypothetical protein
LPHMFVRTDYTPRKTVYFMTHTGMANARVPPLAPSRNGSPGLPGPPDAGRGFSFRLAMIVLPLNGCSALPGGFLFWAMALPGHVRMNSFRRQASTTKEALA